MEGKERENWSKTCLLLKYSRAVDQETHIQHFRMAGKFAVFLFKLVITR